MLESTNLMQQHDFDVLIQEKQQRLNKLKRNMLKRGEMVLRYKSASPLYYREGQKNEEFE
jgi:hypothetical protein